jgi:Zn-dependent protease
MDWLRIGMQLFALVIAIPIHEFAHALSAVNNGDDGPRRDGRISIMPQDHFDVFGAVFCVISTISGFGLGWGKPVLVNPNVLHNPRWGMCKIAAWGPFSNFLLAIAFALPLRLGLVHQESGPAFDLLLIMVMVNLSLMLFNLIPIGPLDGAKIVVAFLPDRQAYEFSRFSTQYGQIALLLLITIGGPVIAVLVGVPMTQILRVLLPNLFGAG